MKIAICCYNMLLSEGMKRLLEGDPTVKVVTLRNDQKCEYIADREPDLLITDLDTFADHSEQILNKGRCKVLIIYNTARLRGVEGQMSEFISKGVAGILPTDTDAPLLKRAIKAVMSGELWLTHKSIREMLMSGQQKVRLTKQEGQIVSHICRGFRNKEIAQALDITEQTVKSHCNRIYRKFNVSDRLQLALRLMHEKPTPEAEEEEKGVPQV